MAGGTEGGRCMSRRPVSRVVVWCSFLALWPSAATAAYRLVHVAGQAESGFSGDGGAAVTARLNRPLALALAPDGALYIADTGNHRVRKITTDGAISTVAGNGTAGAAGDGGPAVEAELDNPSDVAVDGTGNLYLVTASGLRRIDGGDGRISTLFGFASWRYAVANDSLGNVFIAVSPFTSLTSYGPYAQPYLVTLPAVGSCDPPSFVPITVQSIDWRGAAIYRLSAADPQHAALAFDTDALDYGIARSGGRVVLSSNVELYALNRPPGIGLSDSGTLYLTGGSYYTGTRHYIIQRQVFGLASVAGGGSNAVTDGALADTVALDPQAIAVGHDDLLYVVHAPNQVYALRREAQRPGVIAGAIMPIKYSPIVTVLAAGDDGSLHYAQPDRKGRFRFRDLAPATYRVYAHFDEEGLSCDATNCGWSGAPDDCPRSLNDPLVTVTPGQPVHRVLLRLLRTFPCV